jgi:hypothetical protein
VKAVDAVRRPGAGDLDDEIALRSFEFHLEHFRNNNLRRRLTAGGKAQSDERKKS